MPRPEAKWFKDGEPIAASDHMKFGNSGDNFFLTVVRATAEDAGVYSVTFTNKMGQISTQGKLSVAPVEGLRTPKFTKPLTDVDVVTDGAGVFKAVVTGEPVPEATW